MLGCIKDFVANFVKCENDIVIMFFFMSLSVSYTEVFMDEIMWWMEFAFKNPKEGKKKSREE